MKKKVSKKDNATDQFKKFAEEGNTLIKKFMKTSSTNYHKKLESLFDVTRVCIKKINKSSSTQYSAMLWGVKTLSQRETLANALTKSVLENNPIPLFVSVVNTIKWLNDKKK